MKKLIIFIVLIILIGVGIFYIKDFNKTKETFSNTPNNTYEKIEDEENNKNYLDENPIIVGLYKHDKNTNTRKLITNYESNWEEKKDISSFEVYYTNEISSFSGNQKENFDLFKNNYENIDNYKIGYIVEFDIGDKKINKTIISPKDTEEFFNYLEIYLYDDYHRSGEWYSHTTEEEFNSDTLLTSIKLTSGKDISLISSQIKLSAFTYDSDDFDTNGNYIGKSIYSITISNTNL